MQFTTVNGYTAEKLRAAADLTPGKLVFFDILCSLDLNIQCLSNFAALKRVADRHYKRPTLAPPDDLHNITGIIYALKTPEYYLIASFWSLTVSAAQGKVTLCEDKYT